MLNLLWYLLIGYAAIFGAVFIHLVIAETRGYEAIKWWVENAPNYTWTLKFTVGFIFGLFIWPIRLANFLMDLPEYYSMYELKDQEIES